MANPEHVAVLNQGVEAWNAWREANPDIQPDLANVDFAGLDLRGVNLGGANLFGAHGLVSADLTRADLSGAFLRGRDFRWAQLTEADMSEAFLSGADLSEGNLTRANLTGAELTRANLKKSNLTHANLERANLREAYLIDSTLNSAFFGGADLRSARLEKACLRGAYLPGADLESANLRGTDLSGAWLDRTRLQGANLTAANLESASLRDANVSRADFVIANLKDADLSGANLSRTHLYKANLFGACLQYAILVGTNIDGANLENCKVYGISAWDLRGEPQREPKLIITASYEPKITVDDLEVAQFVYLLLTNEKIRNIIDTIGEKGVLILGRFAEERKAVLDAIRGKLRELGFVPMIFDFERPTQRDFSETIKTLAGMSRFIVADITNPRSSPLELQATMPDYMIPFVPIIHEDEEPFAMFQDLKQKYDDWVLDVLKYDSVDGLLRGFDKAVVGPALEKSQELVLKKAEKIRVRHVRDYLD